MVLLITTSQLVHASQDLTDDQIHFNCVEQQRPFSYYIYVLLLFAFSCVNICKLGKISKWKILRAKNVATLLSVMLYQWLFILYYVLGRVVQWIFADELTMSSDEDKAAAVEAELAACCRDVSAELEKVSVGSQAWK